MNRQFHKLAIGLVLLTGCSANTTIPADNIIKGVDFTTFTNEAYQLYMLLDGSNSDYADPKDYPESIRALEPQIVSIHGKNPPTMMIQTSGGFQHKGLLIVFEADDSDHVPSIGKNWFKKEIHPGVFEYRE